MSELTEFNDIQKELGFNFINYAAAVNLDRAIPDATSGLKPVARRILYGAYEGGRVSSKPHVKCAKIVGDVMGTYHPHGDTSIYEALVRLARPWVMRYPLLDFHGNMGNIGGDGPAAQRYTEARLSKLTEEGLLFGLKKKNVPFIPNYDESTEEPITLPSIFPNLLCNPNTGIGVAMACSWLPHNLTEVATAIYDYLDGKEPMLPGPDFPTGGLIINKNDIPDILRTGHGSVKVRGQYKIEKEHNIVFYEIPYGQNTESIITEIGELCDSQEIEGIVDIRDEGNLKGLRIVVQCNKKVNPESIVKILFAKTNLQTSISYNQIALVDKTPVELSLKDCIKIYLKHNEDCLIKETQFDYEKTKDRKEIVEGLLIALEDIDNVITLIKTSESSVVAKESLQKKYGLNEPQAKAIINMKLGTLAGLEKIELQREAEELKETIERLTAILSSSDRRIEIIRERLECLVKKYGDSRRTQLMNIIVQKEDKEIEAVIPEETIVVMTVDGYVKRIPPASLKTQKTKGKGVKNGNDVVLDMIATNTIDSLLIFTSTGKMYKTIVDNIPIGTVASKGTPISNFIKCDPNEKIMGITSLERKEHKDYVVFFTKKGLVKKTRMEEYLKTKRGNGIQSIKLVEGDSIANVLFLDEEQVIVVTRNGMAIRFETKNINPIGRNAAGVKSIKLDEDDEVIGGYPLIDNNEYLTIFSEKGMGKRVSLNEFTIQSRGGKGVICYKPTASTGKIADVVITKDDNEIIIAGRTNSLKVSAADIPVISRTSIGNIVSKTDIISVTKV